MEDTAVPAGAIPADQFQAHQDVAASTSTPPPPGAIPVDQFESNDDAHGTPIEQAKTLAESAAKSVIGPAAPLLEKEFGVKPEDIRGREEANPITAGIGQVAGLAGSALTGVGEGALLEKAGASAAEAVGLGAPTTYAAKVGSAAVKQATEMALLQSSDEASKMVQEDPKTSAESAIANIGMASLLGGATGAFFTGAVSPLWKATVGDRLEGFLGTLSGKLGGTEGAVGDSAGLASKAGIEIPDELKAKIDGTPGAEVPFSVLSQSDTTYAGKKFQKTLGEFQGDVGSKMSEALGHDGSEVPELDKYSTGQKIADSLHSDLQEVVKPINDEYEAINNEFKGAPVSVDNKMKIADDIAQKSMEQGWHKAADDSAIRLMDKVKETLPKQETAADLKNYITNLRNSNPFGSETYGPARDIIKAIESGQGRAITEGILAKGGDSGAAAAKLEQYQALKGKYSDLMNTIDGLNEHLHVGKYDGPKTFLNAVKEMGTTNGEGVLSRLSGKNKAAALEAVGKVSPEALANIRQYHVDNLIRTASDSSGSINPYKLSKNFNQMTPQLKGLVAGAESQNRMEALGQILEKLDDKTHNWSNTARTADKIAHGNVSPLMMVAGLMGHGADAALGHFGTLGLREGRDGIKLATLKFLGSDQPIKSEGFKAMTEFMHNTIKGENTLAKATAAVVKAGAQVLADKNMPAEADRTKLDKQVTKFQDNPSQFTQTAQAGHVGHYLPDHQTAMVQTTANTLRYLQALKPQTHTLSPLDSPTRPTAIQTSRYNRALDIANQPNVVLAHVKDGTLEPTDITDIKSMYPNLYSRMTQKLTNEMTVAHSKGEYIPYATRQGMSLFLGQPMDSTMAPSSIMAAQASMAPQSPQGAPQPQGKTKKGTSTLGKSNKSYMTASQAAEADRGDRE